MEITSQGLPSLTISREILGRDKTIPSTNLPGNTWVYQYLDFTLPDSIRKKHFSYFNSSRFALFVISLPDITVIINDSIMGEKKYHL